MSHLATTQITHDPLTQEFMDSFLERLKADVMSVKTQSIDILESMSIRFLRQEMQSIAYPQTLGAVRLETKLLALANDPTHGEAARFFLNPAFWLKSKTSADNTNLL